MRRFPLYVATVLAVFIVGCGMQRPSRPITPTADVAAPTVVSPLSTPTVIPSVARTPTVTPRGPISPLSTPVVTTTRPINSSPSPTWTPLPTSTGVSRPGSTPTATSRPATAAPATPTVTSFPFVVENAFGAPDCGKTEIGGFLLDTSRRGLSGYRVSIGNVNGAWSTSSGVTGGDGKYSVSLALTPTAGRWYVVVVDSSGKELSPRVQIETTATNCGSGQSGIQIARVDFRKDY